MSSVLSIGSTNRASGQTGRPVPTEDQQECSPYTGFKIRHGGFLVDHERLEECEPDQDQRAAVLISGDMLWNIAGRRPPDFEDSLAAGDHGMGFLPLLLFCVLCAGEVRGQFLPVFGTVEFCFVFSAAIDEWAVERPGW